MLIYNTKLRSFIRLLRLKSSKTHFQNGIIHRGLGIAGVPLRLGMINLHGGSGSSALIGQGFFVGLIGRDVRQRLNHRSVSHIRSSYTDHLRRKAEIFYASNLSSRKILKSDEKIGEDRKIKRKNHLFFRIPSKGIMHFDFIDKYRRNISIRDMRGVKKIFPQARNHAKIRSIYRKKSSESVGIPVKHVDSVSHFSPDENHVGIYKKDKSLWSGGDSHHGSIGFENSSGIKIKCDSRKSRDMLNRRASSSGFDPWASMQLSGYSTGL